MRVCSSLRMNASKFPQYHDKELLRSYLIARGQCSTSGPAILAGYLNRKRSDVLEYSCF